MIIIERSHFTKEPLFIPNVRNLNADDGDTPTANSELDNALERCERDLLINALGVTLFRELETAAENIVQANKMWQSLINGEDYEYKGNMYLWEGLNGYKSTGLIAKYVYSEYLKDDEFLYTTTGIKQNKSENARSSSYNRKYIRVFSQFLSEYQGVTDCSTPSVFYNNKGLLGLDYYKNHTGNTKVSLFEYMTQKNEIDNNNFTDFKFTFFEPLNSFGI